MAAAGNNIDEKTFSICFGPCSSWLLSVRAVLTWSEELQAVGQYIRHGMVYMRVTYIDLFRYPGPRRTWVPQQSGRGAAGG